MTSDPCLARVHLGALSPKDLGRRWLAAHRLAVRGQRSLGKLYVLGHPSHSAQTGPVQHRAPVDGGSRASTAKRNGGVGLYRAVTSRMPCATATAPADAMTEPSFLIPLGPTDLRDAGIPEPWAFGMADRVRFAELDALNHVNNAAYLSWFEALRVRYCAAYHVSDYRPEDPMIVIRDLSARYHAEMTLDEPYIDTAPCGR